MSSMFLATLTAGPHALDWTVAILLALIAVLLFGFVMNLNKLLRRVNSIRQQFRETAESGVGAQLVEVIAQLQSVAVSMDRIALRCDEMGEQVTQIVERGPGGEGAVLEEVGTAMREGLGALAEPLAQIRDAVQRSQVERLSDEVRRVLFNEGYDRVEITTDLSALEGAAEGAENKVQVEVQREGVKAKGYVVVKDGSVVERKISATYEMFP